MIEIVNYRAIQHVFSFFQIWNNEADSTSRLPTIPLRDKISSKKHTNNTYNINKIKNFDYNFYSTSSLTFDWKYYKSNIKREAASSGSLKIKYKTTYISYYNQLRAESASHVFILHKLRARGRRGRREARDAFRESVKISVLYRIARASERAGGDDGDGGGERRKGAKIPRDINRFTGRASKGRSTNRLADEAVLERNAPCRASGGAAPRGNTFRRVRDREGRRPGYAKWG